MKKTLIERIDVGAGGAAQIEFSSIPQSFDGLLVLASLRYATGNTFLNVNIRFNNSSVAEYSQRMLYGTGTTVSSFGGTSQTQIAYIYAADSGATASVFSNSLIAIPNYTASSAKSVSIDSVTENNASAANQVTTAGLWNNSAAISSIQLIGYDANNFVQYSSASLYGITAGSDGVTTVS